MKDKKPKEPKSADDEKNDEPSKEEKVTNNETKDIKIDAKADKKEQKIEEKKEETDEEAKAKQEPEEDEADTIDYEKHGKGTFVIKERDTATGTILLSAAVAMIIGAIYMVTRDRSNALLWIALLIGSAIPLAAIGAFFFRHTTIIIDDKYIKKTNRMGKSTKVLWDRIYAITIEQGVPGDLSVTTLAFWMTVEDGHEHFIFLTTDDLMLGNFASVASELKYRAKKIGMTFQDEKKILKKISWSV